MVHLLLFSLIILVTFHAIFTSFYFGLFQYFHDIWLKYIKFRNGGLVGGFAISSDGFFFKFYRRHYELISKYDTGLKTLLLQGLLELQFYDELVY